MLRLILVLSLTACAIGAPRAHRGLIPRLDGRIVGGEDTTIEQYPYQISLQWWGSHICGGSVVNERTIITAAHCTEGSAPADLSIRAGSTYRSSGGVTVAVSAIIPHGSYDDETLEYDYSVIHLSDPLTYSDSIQPIELAAQGEETASGTPARVSGWGTLYSGGPSPEILQVVTVPIVSNEECNEAYGDDMITDSMICAGKIGVGGVDACQGDSGGPLVANDRLVGVVSWGFGCALPEYPGVYARVAHARTWIDSVTSN